ncbi:unnamed protein product, partial [Polarella glacialis]
MALRQSGPCGHYSSSIQSSGYMAPTPAQSMQPMQHASSSAGYDSYGQPGLLPSQAQPAVRHSQGSHASLKYSTPTASGMSSWPSTPSQSSSAVPVISESAVSSLFCAAGHRVVPTNLRFYQGFLHTRMCRLCAAQIHRDELRHRCEPCDYDVCLRCFERHNLGRTGPGYWRPPVPPQQQARRMAPPLPVSGCGRRPPLAMMSEADGNSDSDDLLEEVVDDGGSGLLCLPGKASSGGFAGVGQFGLPQAESDINVSADRLLGEASSLGDYDLRKYIQTGDIINYLGGNAWGHTVLVLSPPRAFQAPFLVDADPSTEVLGSNITAYIVK